MNHPRANEVLEQLVKSFESDQVDLVGDVARTMIARRRGSRPSDSWSLMNRLLMLCSKTEDGRTFNAWKAVGRFPKKGSHAFWILRPITKKVTKEVTDTTTGETKDVTRSVMLGFTGQAEFRLEDTEHPQDTVDANGNPVYMVTMTKDPKTGEKIDPTVMKLEDALPKYEPITPPPLADVAKDWGVSVTYTPFDGLYWGAYAPSVDAIELGTHDAVVFFHELAHAAHRRVAAAQGRTLPIGQEASKEVVAELSAAVLGRLYGVKMEAKSYQYIRRYAGDKVGTACVKALSDVQAVLDLILDTAEGNFDVDLENQPQEADAVAA